MREQGGAGGSIEEAGESREGAEWSQKRARGSMGTERALAQEQRGESLISDRSLVALSSGILHTYEMIQ